MTSEAQPGQEQRMELKACERCGGSDQTVNGCQLENSQSWSVMCACGHQSAFAASTEGAVAAWNTRPTADLGDDGKLVKAREALNEAQNALMAARQVILGTWADEALAKIDAALGPNPVSASS